mgnify:CR=1 FL=1
MTGERFPVVSLKQLDLLELLSHLNARAGHQKVHRRVLGQPLQFGGVSVAPGEWLYADEDGIVVSATSLLG